MGGAAGVLWDEGLPVEVKELPEDLAELDRVLGDPELTMVLVERLRQEVVETGRAVLTDGPADDRDGDLCQVDGVEGQVSLGTGRWLRRCRTRFICAASAGSACESGCRTS